MNFLVIAAHPDDEILGCGGTIARLSDAGHTGSVVILGEGITSRFDKRTEANRADIEALHKRSVAAARIVGVKDVHVGDLPDNRFDSVDLLDIVKRIERHIESRSPAMIFTQHGGDLNIDHVITYRATLIATRPLAGSGVSAVFGYSVASSSEWAF